MAETYLKLSAIFMVAGNTTLVIELNLASISQYIQMFQVPSCFTAFRSELRELYALIEMFCICSDGHGSY